MAKVVRLRARQDLVERETAAQIVAQLSLYPPEKLPAQSRAAVLKFLSVLSKFAEVLAVQTGGE